MSWSRIRILQYILMYLTDNESKSKIAELQKHKRPKSIKNDS